MTLQKSITLEEFLAQPETKPYREYLNGEVVEKTMGKRDHSRLQARLARLLDSWADSPGHGEVLTELRCILTTPAQRHVQLPDVSWFSRTPKLDDGNALTPPDLAVEILSPDDRFSRVNLKLRIYLEAGTKEVWLVDPEERTILIRRRAEEEHLLEAIDESLESPLLPGFSVGLGDLFRVLDTSQT
ncbi:MAG TPA: Uma2 family endonuclease [Candidatus Xenobia bacterium]|jgi:Uma2 family endonuclease